MKYIPKEIHENVNVSKVSPTKEFLILLGGSLGIAALIYIALGFVINFYIPRMSPQTEKKIGSYLLKHFIPKQQPLKKTPSKTS